jgi:hypothetical protein
MSSSVPSVVRPQDCCASSCDSTVSSNIPGPAGPSGANGNNGTNGTNAFTTVSAQFVMPAIAGTVVVTVADSSWAAIGQKVFVQGAGYFTVTAKTDGTHMTLQNTGYTGNAAPAAIIAAANQISPGGIKGTDGAAGSATLNDLSPTTTKGDIIVDNGANSPNAGDVRLGVGSDGQMIAAVAAQPTGLQWKTILPNSTTDNGVPRFDGTTGTPVPVQTSKVIIDDDGAIQASGTGGDARGAKAVDLQVDRASSGQVASGAGATIAGGLSNEASGDYSSITGGRLNSTTSDDAAVLGGSSNNASDNQAAVVGGSANSAQAPSAVVLGGTNNTASGQESFVIGGTGNTASGLRCAVIMGSGSAASKDFSIAVGSKARAHLFGQYAQASGQIAALGDAQASRLTMNGKTVNVTPLEIFLDGLAGGSERLVLPNDTTWAFRMLIVARRTDVDDESAAYQLLGCIDRNANAASTALVGSVTKTVIAEDTAGWDVNATADNVNGALIVTVTGENAKTLYWVCAVELTQVTG